MSTWRNDKKERCFFSPTLVRRSARKKGRKAKKNKRSPNDQVRFPVRSAARTKKKFDELQRFYPISREI